MKVRKYAKEDSGAMARLLRLAFGGEASWSQGYFDPEKNPRMDLDGVHVVEEDGEPRASATVLPLEVRVDGATVPMGGIAAVCADPAYRRRGYAGELMRAALRDMGERGVHLSMLWPFNHAFYRKFGYELASESIAYTASPRHFPTDEEQRHVRAFADGDLADVMDVFGREADRYRLCVMRSEKRWKQVTGEGKEPHEREAQIAVYKRDGEVEGYVLYSMSGHDGGEEPDREMQVRDFVVATPRAREGLTSFLGALDPDDFKVLYRTSQRNPLHPYLPDSYVKAAVEPEFMLRLVDVEGALRYVAGGTTEPLVLEVSDDGIPGNEGRYTLGNGEIRRGGDGESVRLDVRRLAQLYAGYLPAKQMAERGLILPSSDGTLDLLEKYFPMHDPWVFPPDHF